LASEETLVFTVLLHLCPVEKSVDHVNSRLSDVNSWVVLLEKKKKISS
jgi:hypothetical protein